MGLLKGFCIGAVIGLMVVLGLFAGDPFLTDTITASSTPWLPATMLLVAFAGLFGIVYLATLQENGQPSERQLPGSRRHVDPRSMCRPASRPMVSRVRRRTP